MTLQATYLGSSGWIIDFDDVRLLVDPWLTGTLKFPPGSWLIEGILNNDIEVPSNIDILLLTQGLADHAHVPSLKLLDRSIQVVGSKSASNVVKSLSFQKVIALKPGEEKKIKNISIKATAGPSVPNTENGYLITSDSGSIYIEPHGFLDSSIPSCELDAVITPVINLGLPITGYFIEGKNVLPELINRFKPLSILASTTGGDSNFNGILTRLIQSEGSIEIAKKLIGQKSTLINPIPLKKYNLKVRPN